MAGRKAQGVPKPVRVEQTCITCQGEGMYCYTCGEPEAQCICDPEDQNVGDCEDCSATGKVIQEQ